MHQGTAVPALEPATADAEPVRVLHVDDDASQRKLTRSFLEREGEGITVETVPDARAGRKRLAEGGIECIISDYEMPGTDGIAFLEAVREDHSEIPFILFTGKGSEGIASEAISTGVTDYLQKGGPEQYRVLANRVENAVERYRARLALAESRRQFATFLENFSGIAYRSAPEPPWPMAFIRGRVEDVTGYPREAFESGEVVYGEDPIVEEDAADLEEGVRSAVAEGDSFETIYRIWTADGERRYVWGQGTPVVEDGETVAIEGCLINITDRREREAKIRGLQGRMDDLIRAGSRREIAAVAVEAAEGTLELPLSGVYLVEGDVLEPAAVTDGVRDRFESAPVYCRTDPERSIDRLIWGTFERGEAVVIDDVREVSGIAESETPSASGIVHPLGDHGVFVTSSPEPEAFDGTDEALVEILATTVRAVRSRAAQEGFSRGAGGDGIEELAGVLGHDLRNPLGVAAGRLELAREDREGDHLDAAAEAVERTREIVEDVLELARGGEVVADFEWVRIGDLATRCWEHVETGEATLRADSEAVVLADRSRLARVFENLFRNTIDHGGTEVRIGDLAGGFYVEDDGPGIAPADRRQAFEVGYSTSAEETGFGLGIVAAHGWKVAVREGIRGGARFEITGVPLR